MRESCNEKITDSTLNAFSKFDGNERTTQLIGEIKSNPILQVGKQENNHDESCSSCDKLLFEYDFWQKFCFQNEPSKMRTPKEERLCQEVASSTFE